MKKLIKAITRKPQPKFPQGTILTDTLEREIIRAQHVRYF